MKAIENISIPVSDQQRAKQFYLQLGFEVLAEVRLSDESSWIQLGLKDQVTTISLVRNCPSGPMKAGGLQGLVLETDNIHQEREALYRKGINVSPISESPYGKFFFLHDPDHNGLSIHEFY